MKKQKKKSKHQDKTILFLFFLIGFFTGFLCVSILQVNTHQTFFPGEILDTPKEVISLEQIEIEYENIKK